MRILMVDDELHILESMERSLKPTGYEIFPFQSSREALEAYSEEKFDVVVTDFMMPEMNGIEVLIAIKTMDPEARVIIFTGYADIENAIAAVNNGAYAFFRKPLDFREFMGTLTKIEHEIKNKQQKEIDMVRFQREYTGLLKTYESLLNVVREMDGNSQEKAR